MAQLVLWIFLFVITVLTSANQAAKLEGYNVDPLSTTISGLSSGGAMAMQLHVTYSGSIHGAGIIAGIPFSCGKGGLIEATKCLSNPEELNVDQLVANINTLASAGQLDGPINLNGDKAFVFNGALDETVKLGVGLKVKELYERYGVQVDANFELNANHGYPTNNSYGAPCDEISPTTQFINNCRYNAAYHTLNYLYNENLVEPTGSVELSGYFDLFDQAEFGASSAISMDVLGFVYVPSHCVDKTKTCKFHIVLHGCMQSRTYYGTGDILPRMSGYLEVAELNDIILIFPQTIANILVGNPNACWDWWGYLNPNFLTRNGAQMQVIFKMMQRVLNGEQA
jgi:predicted esterase